MPTKQKRIEAARKQAKATGKEQVVRHRKKTVTHNVMGKRIKFQTQEITRLIPTPATEGPGLKVVK